MKIRAYKKDFKNENVYCVGYCDLYYLLKYQDPIYYITRVEGWGCDIYKVENVYISTGYDPIGKKLNPKTIKNYNEKARQIDNLQKKENESWDQFINNKRNKINKLLFKFIEKIGG